VAGQDALNVVLGTAAGDLDDQLAASGLVQLADEIGVGVRCDAVQLDVQGARAPVVIDVRVRERLRDIAGRPALPRADTVVGTLVEADFERGTARLRAVGQRPVRVSLDDDLADEIQEALRRPAELVGEVTYDRETGVARSAALRRISRWWPSCVLVRSRRVGAHAGASGRKRILRQHYVVLTPTDRVVTKFAALYAVARRGPPEARRCQRPMDGCMRLVHDPPMRIVTGNLRDFEKTAETAPALTLVHPDLIVRNRGVCRADR
jgi:hypothetical protein